MMAEKYTSDMLGVVIAQIAQTIGYSSTQSAPLELLQDILQRFIQELARDLRSQAEHANRVEVNLKDAFLSLKNLNINVNELLDYIGNVEPIPFVRDVPVYPVKRRSNLNFLKPGSVETLTRPVHIFEYLPPMLPPEPASRSADKSDHESIPLSTLEANHKTSAKLLDVKDDIAATCAQKWCAQTDSTMTINSLSRDNFEHDDHGLRELSSVVMTTGGFISPAIEGKLPEAFVPDIIDKFKGLDAPPVPPTAKKQDHILQESDDDLVSKKNALLETKCAEQGPTIHQNVTPDSNGVKTVLKASTTPVPAQPITKTTKRNKKKKLTNVRQKDQTAGDLNTNKAQEKAHKKALKIFQKLSKSQHEAGSNITILQKSIKNLNRGMLSELPDGSNERMQLEKYIKKQSKQRQKQQKSQKQQRHLLSMSKISEIVPNTTPFVSVCSTEPGSSLVPLAQPLLPNIADKVLGFANPYLGSTLNFENKDSFQPNLTKDMSCTRADDLPDEIKLASEPDRNKLNIFKKISKQKAQNTLKSGKKLFENSRIDSPLISLPSGTTITPAPALTATENITLTPHNFNMSISSNMSTYDSFGGLSEPTSVTKNIVATDLNKPKKRGRKPGGKNQSRPKLLTSTESTSFQQPKKIKSTKLNAAAFSYTPDSVMNTNPSGFPTVPLTIEPLNLSSVDNFKNTHLTDNNRIIGNISVESATVEANSEILKLQKFKEKKERKKVRSKSNLDHDNDNVQVTSTVDSDRDFKNNICFMDLERHSKIAPVQTELLLKESSGTINKNMQMQSAELPDCSSNQINDFVAGSGPSSFANPTAIYASNQPNLLPMLPLLHFPPRPGLIPSGLGIFPPTSLAGFHKKVVGNGSSNIIMPHSFIPFSNAGQSTTIGHRPSLIAKDDKITQSGILPHTDNRLERSYCNVAPLVPEFMKLPTPLTDTNKSRTPDPNAYEVKPSKDFVLNSHISTFIPMTQEVSVDNEHINQSLKSTKTIKFSPAATGNLGDPIEVSDDSNDDEFKESKTTRFGSYTNLQGLKSGLIQPSNLSTSGQLHQTEKLHTSLLNANPLHSPISDCKQFKKDVKTSLKINQPESNPLQPLTASPHPSQYNINFMSNDKFSLAGGADLIPLSRVDSGLAYSSLTVPVTSLAAGATSGSMPSNAAFQADDQHFVPNFIGSVNYDDITITPTNNLSINDLKFRKLHKKIKKPKDGKIKKKKDKKDKTRNKEKSEEKNALNIEKNKNQDKKLKKDKKKEKQVTPDGIPFLQENISVSLHKTKNQLPAVVDVAVTGGLSPIKIQAPGTHQTLSPKVGLSPNQVPKLTLKLSGKSTPTASTFEGDHDSTITDSTALTPTQTKKEHSPELARFSPLVTGPPKPKPCETQTMSLSSAATSSSISASIVQTQTTSMLGVQPTGLNASASGWLPSSITAASATLSASSVLLPQQLMQPSKQIPKMPAVSSSTSISTVAGAGLPVKTGGLQTVPPACAELNRPSSYVDAEGYRIWICPACGKVDDGSAMIGCDGCDAWYHWTCVGIHVAPNDNEDWFCRVCVSKKKVGVLDKKKKRHNKKK